MRDNYPRLTLSPLLNHTSRLWQVIPAGKRVPSLYFLLSSQLASTNQSLHILRDIRHLPARSPYVAIVANRRTIYDPSPSSYRRRVGYASTSCPVCGRPAISSVPETPPPCSTICQLAIHLFLNDLLAVTRQRTFSKTYEPGNPFAFRLYAMLRLVPPNALPPDLLRARDLHYHDVMPWYLTGNFADDYGLNFGSSLLIHPLAIRRTLRRHLKETSMPSDDDDILLPPATPSSAPPASTESTHIPEPTSAPAAPASAVPAVPASPGPIEIASLQNPVTRRMAEIVLSHLETANDFLSATPVPTPGRKTPRRATHWSKDQVTLFLGLLNRTIPSVSASINLSATPEPKDPSDMSREELEAAAQRARLIGPSTTRDHGKHKEVQDVGPEQTEQEDD
jgi:hypothetical protein